MEELQQPFLIFVPYCDVYTSLIITCLESISKQVYRQFQVIIVNDGAKDLKYVTDFISGKENYTIVHRELKGGPAASKWTFLHYIQSNIRRYNLNDIAMIVDGDDSLANDHVLATINKTYLQTKCWMTYGNADGKFCDNGRSIPPEWTQIRSNPWIYTHPRTFKIALALTFQETDFQINGVWLTKGTDRPIVLNCIEIAGINRCKFIETVLYNYVEHEQNSYKTVSNESRLRQLHYLTNLPKKKELAEDIHIVMCCWKRIEYLEQQIKNMNDQTVAHRIRFHLLNNNPETIEQMNKLFIDVSHIYTNIKLHLSHYKNEFYGFQRFMYIRDILLKYYNIDYVIIIDDDQIFTNDWVEKMVALKKPQTYSAFYGKLWNTSNLNYWTGTRITFKDCYTGTNPEIKEFHYGGTGGSILDVSIFRSDSKLWDIPKDLPEGVSIYNIEDLWLSFVIRKYYGWSIQRTFLPDKNIINIKGSSAEANSLYKIIYAQKQLLLTYLIGTFGL